MLGKSEERRNKTRQGASTLHTVAPVERLVAATGMPSERNARHAWKCRTPYAGVSWPSRAESVQGQMGCYWLRAADC